MNPNHCLVLLAWLLLAGCTSSKVWYRAGVTANQVERDLAYCRFEARRSSAGSPTLVGDQAPIAFVLSRVAINNIINDCMKEKGYTLLPVKEVPASARVRLNPAKERVEPVRLARQFREDDFTSFRNSGNASIRGQAFMKTRGGDVKLGAGCTVILFPSTPYTTELFERAIIGDESIESVDTRLNDYVRTTVANASGEFEFSGLSSGDYYFACQISWEHGSPQGLVKTGGIAFAKAHAEEGKNASVVVTR